MVGIGEYGVVQQGGGPPVVAGVERGLGELDDAVDAAERVDVAGGQLGGRMRPQPRRVAVEPAHVALVDRLDVVADRAVVAVGAPRVGQGRRQLDHLGDLGARVALVEQAQGLVVQVGVEVALRRRYAMMRSRPQVGQWCEAKATSVRSPNVSIASVR